MNAAQRRTLVIVVIATVVLVGYDVVTVFQAGQDATISLVITSLSHTHPIIAFAFGVRMGHFFWQNE